MRLSGRIVIPVIFGILFTGVIPSYAGPPLCIGDIDFDFFPDGTPVPNETKLTNQYTACGVTLFTTTDPLGPSVRGFALSTTSSAPNLLIPQPKNTEDPIGIEFVSPVTEASINAIGVGFNGLILDALDSGGSIIDTVSVVHPGTPEGSDILTVSGDGIVELLIHQITPGGKQGFLIDGYGIDDLTFTLSGSPPPPTLQEQIDALIFVVGQLFEIMVGGFELLGIAIDNLQTQIDNLSQTHVIRFNAGNEQTINVNPLFFVDGNTEGSPLNGFLDFRRGATLVGVDGEITELRYDIGAGPVGFTATVSLWKNNVVIGSCSVVTTTIPTSCIVSLSEPVSAGDLIAVSHVSPAGSVGVQFFHASVVIES